MINLPDAALGAIGAAAIAGTITFIGLIISKEQKISDFRQTWIDALRADLAVFLTHINAIHDAMNTKYSDDSKKIEKLSSLYIALNTANFNILLRIAPKDHLSRNLLSVMEGFNLIARDETSFTVQNIRHFETQLLTACHELLGAEWKRVKAGEATFRAAKIAAAILILGSAILAVYAASASKGERPATRPREALILQSTDCCHIDTVASGRYQHLQWSAKSSGRNSRLPAKA